MIRLVHFRGHDGQRGLPVRTSLVALLVCTMLGGSSARAMTVPPGAALIGGHDQPPELVVLANNTGLAELDSAGLRAVFRGERSQWPSERRVTVVLPSSRAEFAGTISRMLFRSSPGGMQRFWLALVFQGRAAPPIFVDSVDEMVSYVRRTPGAIALVPRDSVSTAGPLLVRVR